MKLKKEQPRILQICNSSGSVRIDEVQAAEDGLNVEGAVAVSLCMLHWTIRSHFRCCLASFLFPQDRGTGDHIRMYLAYGMYVRTAQCSYDKQ